MKFFYNGKLVRTSRTHNYRYAIIMKEDAESDAAKIKPFACSKDMTGIDSNLAYLSKDLRMWEAVKNGTYVKKNSHYFSREQLIAQANEWYGSVDAAIQKQKELFSQWIVVKLEAQE